MTKPFSMDFRDYERRSEIVWNLDGAFIRATPVGCVRPKYVHQFEDRTAEDIANSGDEDFLNLVPHEVGATKMSSARVFKR
jgi:hypothetical protein